MIGAIEFVKIVGIYEARELLQQRKYNTAYLFHEEHTVDFDDLESVVDSHDLVDGFYGLSRAKKLLDENTFDASYISTSGHYFRYGSHDVYTVRNGEYTIVHGGIDCNQLIHVDRLKNAISVVEKCQ